MFCSPSTFAFSGVWILLSTRFSHILLYLLINTLSQTYVQFLFPLIRVLLWRNQPHCLSQQTTNRTHSYFYPSIHRTRDLKNNTFLFCLHKLFLFLFYTKEKRYWHAERNLDTSICTIILPFFPLRFFIFFLISKLSTFCPTSQKFWNP